MNMTHGSFLMDVKSTWLLLSPQLMPTISYHLPLAMWISWHLQMQVTFPTIVRTDRLNFHNRIFLEQKTYPNLYKLYYVSILQPFVQILCVHRWNLSFKVIWTKKGKWESDGQIFPINFTTNACEISHSEYMPLFLET